MTTRDELLTFRGQVEAYTADALAHHDELLTSMKEYAAIAQATIPDEADLLSDVQTFLDAAVERNAETVHLTGVVSTALLFKIDKRLAEIPPPPPPGPNFKNLYFTESELAALSTKSDAYSDLLAVWAGRVSRTPAYIDYGTTVSTDERDRGLKDEGVYVYVQALLYQAEMNDGTAAQKATAAQRKAVIIKMLDGLRRIGEGVSDITNGIFARNADGSSPEQHRLVLGWCIPNWCKAASIVGYKDPGFERFLRSVALPLLNWTGVTNWTASFSEAKGCVAVYLEDPALYAEFKRYFYERISQNIYSTVHDNGLINPLHSEDGQSGPLHAAPGTPHLTKTLNTWYGNPLAGATNPTKITAVYRRGPANMIGKPFADGAGTEDLRDLGHSAMGNAANLHAARIIVATGDTLDASVYDRLRAAYDNLAKRVLYYAKNNKYMDPVPSGGHGGGARFMGWYEAKAFFGDDTPAAVLELLTRQEVTSIIPGANHTVAGALAP